MHSSRDELSFSKGSACWISFSSVFWKHSEYQQSYQKPRFNERYSFSSWRWGIAGSFCLAKTSRSANLCMSYATWFRTSVICLLFSLSFTWTFRTWFILRLVWYCRQSSAWARYNGFMHRSIIYWVWVLLKIRNDESDPSELPRANETLADITSSCNTNLVIILIWLFTIIGCRPTMFTYIYIWQW